MTRFHVFLASALTLGSATAIAEGLSDLPDRPISRSEVVGVLDQQFRTMDGNRDGKISRNEFEAYLAKEKAGALPAKLSAFAHVSAHWFDKADADGDGTVSRAEAAARPLKMFDLADINHDGTISLEERKMASVLMSLRGK
jgi:Ca2+-binding EF-hand superfamily protein